MAYTPKDIVNQGRVPLTGVSSPWIWVYKEYKKGALLFECKNCQIALNNIDICESILHAIKILLFMLLSIN